MSQDQVVNYVVLTIVVGALVIGLVSMLIGRIVAAWDAFAAWWGVGIQKAIHTRPVKRYQVQQRPVMSYYQEDEREGEPYEPEHSRSDRFPLPNGTEPQSSVHEPNANAANLHLNVDEVAALQRMIEHNKTAAKPSKTSTIQAGFGLSRGGGDKYHRASLIYDALFGPPAPAVKYRERTPEQEALRKQLNLR